MTKIKLVFFISLFFLACENKQTNQLQLTGTIKGLKEGTLYVQRVIDTSVVTIDTIRIDGKSSFKTEIKLTSPEVLFLFLDRGVSNSLDNSLMFFAEPGKMNINTSLDFFLADAVITGSKNNDLLTEYKKQNSVFNNIKLDLIEKQFKAMINKNQKSLDSVNKAQELNLKKQYLHTVNFAVNHGDYEIAPYLALSEIYDINIRFLDTIQKSMRLKVAHSFYGKKLEQHIASLKK